MYSQCDDPSTIHLYTKDSFEAKYQFFMNKHEDFSLKHFKDPKTFIKCSDDINDIYKILMSTIQKKTHRISLCDGWFD